MKLDLPPTPCPLLGPISSLLSGNLVEEWRYVCLRIVMDQMVIVLPLLEWAFADNIPLIQGLARRALLFQRVRETLL